MFSQSIGRFADHHFKAVRDPLRLLIIHCLAVENLQRLRHRHLAELRYVVRTINSEDTNRFLQVFTFDPREEFIGQLPIISEALYGFGHKFPL